MFFLINLKFCVVGYVCWKDRDLKIFCILFFKVKGRDKELWGGYDGYYCERVVVCLRFDCGLEMCVFSWVFLLCYKCGYKSIII